MREMAPVRMAMSLDRSIGGRVRVFEGCEFWIGSDPA
jgi:hypothetical protein